MDIQESEDEFIQSRQNPRVKALAKLRDRSGRRKLGLFCVEGLRELSRAVNLVSVDEIYYAPELFVSREHSEFLENVRFCGKIKLCRLSAAAFEKVSNREGPDGLLGVAQQWPTRLEDIPEFSTKTPRILVADSIEKPGNLGALMRTADALGANALILTNPVTDIFNPGTVRASQGAIFSVNLAVASPIAAAEWLHGLGVRIFGAHLGASKALWHADFSGGCAIVVGSEKDGLGDDWVGLLDEKIKIPMSGASDSMNVNVAAAVCMYEALRQSGEMK